MVGANWSDEAGVTMKDHLTPATIAEIRRQYRMDKLCVFIRYCVRIWWTRDIIKLTATNAQQVAHYRKVFNKCTLFYYAQEAQRPNPGWNTAYLPDEPGAAVYKAWYQIQDDQPNIDWDRYFAYPLQLAASGPSTVSELVKMHRKICQRATEYHARALQIKKGPWTDINEVHNPRNYMLYPLCSALLVVQDNDVDPRMPCRTTPSLIRPNGGVALDRYSQAQTVVLVRTGDEEDLSKPIDFSALAHKALPLARSDATTHDALRVSIYDAVNFIAELQKNEEVKNPEFYYNPRIDTRKNPYLTLSKSTEPNLRDRLWYPASEDEYVAELLTIGKYAETEDLIKSAKERARRLEAGDEDWDDLERNKKYGNMRI
ncbi:hypothetical protein P171DRAFT_432024 [Karstenula rhodostoma CBS 690.94]|uniref:Uncharacterized protein n=1 Tax=Karstenula rhodostoma CBS 690.94 TaxID=1392251 RepID=A0A9P4PIS8_9PLEO|nr:hypothetical protein P171DRAFT_432024 [Karstenula rhodostoma CBS 690.94]